MIDILYLATISIVLGFGCFHLVKEHLTGTCKIPGIDWGFDSIKKKKKR